MNFSRCFSEPVGADGDHMKDVDFDQLFQHFISVQEMHSAFKQSKRYQVSISV